MTIDTKDLRGDVLKGARVEWMNPNFPATLLEIAGRIRERLEIKPPYVLLEAFPGERKTAALTITNQDANPLRIARVRTGRPDVEAKLEEVEPGRKFNLTVTRDPALPAGTYRGQVELDLEHSAQPNPQIPVTIIVKRKVHLDRGAVMFRRRQNDPNPKPTITVMVEKYKDASFQVKSLRCNLPYVDSEIVALPNRGDVTAYELRFTWRRVDGPPDPFKGTVTFETSDKDFPQVTLPVMGPGRGVGVAQASSPERGQGGQK